MTSAVAAIVIGAAACGGAITIQPPAEPPTPDTLKQLWVDPGSEPRDLFWGIGGQKYAPKPEAIYTFKERDAVGFSTKYIVKDPDGIEWNAKIGPEAQVEVLLSRILCGLGFHQQPIYYLPSWTMDEHGAKSTVSEARVGAKMKQFELLDEDWWWQQNPFVATRELSGLLVVLLMFNGKDLKNDNNSIYTFKEPAFTEPVEGATRWFVVRDL